jgi:hypothetical protein
LSNKFNIWSNKFNAQSIKIWLLLGQCYIICILLYSWLYKELIIFTIKACISTIIVWDIKYILYWASHLLNIMQSCIIVQKKLWNSFTKHYWTLYDIRTTSTLEVSIGCVFLFNIKDIIFCSIFHFTVDLYFYFQYSNKDFMMKGHVWLSS